MYRCPSECMCLLSKLTVDPIYILTGKIKFMATTLFSGADPGFLERGIICIKLWGSVNANFISFFLNIP